MNVQKRVPNIWPDRKLNTSGGGCGKKMVVRIRTSDLYRY